MHLSYSKLAHTAKIRAYSLVEVLVASSILMMGLTVACMLSMNTITVEEMNFKQHRGYTHVECAARLWQLGLSPTEIATVLPRNPDVELDWTSTFNPQLQWNVGNLEGLTLKANIYTTPDNVNAVSQTGLWTLGATVSNDPADRPKRPHSVTLLRSALR
jgi:hypothetical protein